MISYPDPNPWRPRFNGGPPKRRGRCRWTAAIGCVLCVSFAANVVQHLAYGSAVSKVQGNAQLHIDAANKRADEIDYACNTERGRWNATVDRLVRRAQEAIDADQLGEAVLILDQFAGAVQTLSPGDPRRIEQFERLMNQMHEMRNHP